MQIKFTPEKNKVAFEVESEEDATELSAFLMRLSVASNGNFFFDKSVADDINSIIENIKSAQVKVSDFKIGDIVTLTKPKMQHFNFCQSNLDGTVVGFSVDKSAVIVEWSKFGAITSTLTIITDVSILRKK